MSVSTHASLIVKQLEFVEETTPGLVPTNPAIIGPKNIEVYDYNTHLQYRVYGNHPQDVLMKIMESLIRE
jgi:hypothetical protein